MKVTIVTVAYKAAQTIGDTMRSVQGQNYPDIEHVIVDGASPDNTLDIVKQLANESTRVISEPDHGPYDAMNKGLTAASGDLIGFLNADDFLCRTDAIDLLVKAVTAARASAVIGGVVFARDGSFNKALRTYPGTGFRPWMLRFGHMPPHPGFYMTRQTRDRVGLFDQDLRIGGDLEWMLRFYFTCRLYAITIPETIVTFRPGGISTRGLSSLTRINAEALASLRRHGVWSHQTLLWFKYLFKSLQYVLPTHAFPPPTGVAWYPPGKGPKVV